MFIDAMDEPAFRLLATMLSMDLVGRGTAAVALNSAAPPRLACLAPRLLPLTRARAEADDEVGELGQRLLRRRRLGDGYEAHGGKEPAWLRGLGVLACGGSGPRWRPGGDDRRQDESAWVEVGEREGAKETDRVKIVIGTRTSHMKLLKSNRSWMEWHRVNEN